MESTPIMSLSDMQGFEYMELSVMKSDAVFQMMFDWLIETTVLLFWIFWSLVTLDLNFLRFCCMLPV